MLTLQDRLSGGLIRLLVGDALGVLYEFCLRCELPVPLQMEFVPPPGFQRSHPRGPPGIRSDDGAQALCLLATLIECGSLDLAAFSSKLLQWFPQGTFTADRKIFDCGIQTREALRRLSAGITPDRAARAESKITETAP